MNEPIGRFGSCSPARLRRTASDYGFDGFVLSDNPFAAHLQVNSFSLSLCSILLTGMPVQRETYRRRRCLQPLPLPWFIALSPCFFFRSSLDRLDFVLQCLNLSVADFSHPVRNRLHALPCRPRTLVVRFPSCSAESCLPVPSHSAIWPCKEVSCSFSSAISLFSWASLASSFSRLIASRSISSCFQPTFNSSSSSGSESRSIRSLAPLHPSGRWPYPARNGRWYNGCSVPLPRWWLRLWYAPDGGSHKRSFSPRRMEIEDCRIGSSTMTVLKRRSNALSFSKYFWYSSRVVAPMLTQFATGQGRFKNVGGIHGTFPFPAPTSVWISSIKGWCFRRTSSLRW